jgi:rRNA maturation protein Nop10
MAPVKRVVGGVALGVGVLLVLYGAARWWYDARVFARMSATTCTLVSKKVDWKLRASSKRPGKSRVWYEAEAHLEFAHTLDGRQYTFTDDDQPHEGFDAGKSYPCRYDPTNPRHATLAASFDPDYDNVMLGGVLILLSVVLRARGDAHAER